MRQAGRIGKYTRFLIRAGKPPARVDRCLVPAKRRPSGAGERGPLASRWRRSRRSPSVPRRGRGGRRRDLPGARAARRRTSACRQSAELPALAEDPAVAARRRERARAARRARAERRARRRAAARRAAARRAAAPDPAAAPAEPEPPSAPEPAPEPAPAPAPAPAPRARLRPPDLRRRGMRPLATTHSPWCPSTQGAILDGYLVDGDDEAHERTELRYTVRHQGRRTRDAGDAAPPAREPARARALRAAGRRSVPRSPIPPHSRCSTSASTPAARTS